MNKSAQMLLSDDRTIQVVAKGGGRSELRRSIGSKLHATQNDLALPVDDCYWPLAEVSDSGVKVCSTFKSGNDL
jgi:hypothetical protein